MATVNLHTRKLNLGFYHKNSEINYDPSNKFYQVAFSYDFEKEIYDFIDSFINLVFSDSRFKDFGALPGDRNMTGFYFDLLADFSGLEWEKYNKWYYERKVKVQLKIKNIIVNAINSQKQLGIEDLEFFAWLSTETLISLIVEDYFMKHFEKLNIMKESLINHLGKIFEIIFSEIFHDGAIERLRSEKTNSDSSKIQPLINRHLLTFNDVAVISVIEKNLLQKDNSIHIDRTIMNKMLSAFETVVEKSKRIKRHDSIRGILGEIPLIKIIFSGRKDRREFIKIIKKDKEFIQRITVKYEKHVIYEAAKALLADTGSSGIINMIRQPELVEELFQDKKLKKHIMKILLKEKNKKAQALAKYINEACERVGRSNKTFFKSLHPGEFEKIMWKTISNLSFCLTRINDFYMVRKKYGRKSAYSDEISGIKILRQSVIKQIETEEDGFTKQSIECVMIPDDQKTRIENLFEEANLFYFRGEGPVYPGIDGAGGRGKKLFMFADLRNSTETTMKLTKDTAGFLTPYLNTVYKVSKNHKGNEIYFAGDGYAAHFSSAADCARACYLIHREFSKLRKEAESKIKSKEKLIFREMIKLGIIGTDGKIKKIKKIPEKTGEDIEDVIKEISKGGDIKTDDIIRKVAEEYSMPRVEMGIGVTEGELFVAVIGEENVRFNIVLSPSLTQAARLSGSNAEVKAYVEGLYGIKNIPRRVYVQHRRLFNQGVVVTGDFFNRLRGEVEVDIIDKEDIDLSYNVYYYYDRELNKYLSMAKLEQGVALKGIEHDVDVFEFFTPAAGVDAYINNWIIKNRKKSL